MAQVEKKTSTMSVTVTSCSCETTSLSSTSSSSSSVLQQKHPHLVQPLCISPQLVQNNNQGSGNVGVSPTYVKCLHDVSTLKGQLVVLECRVRGTPPLQISWYREDKQIIDSADLRILRKKASSAFIPEELCTLVITEACPEDSGIFKCIASNQFGTVTCSAMLEVYTDLEEVLGDEQDPSSIQSDVLVKDDHCLVLQDTCAASPEWPKSSEEETATPMSWVLESGIKKVESLPDTDSEQSSVSKVAEDTNLSPMIKLDSPPKGVKNSVPHPFLLTSKLNKQVESKGSATNVADLPTFSPSLYPPSAFNYERPRHFIQSLPSFHTHDTETSKPNDLCVPATTPAPLVTPPLHAPTQTLMCSSMTLIPKARSTPNSENLSPAAFLSSVLPSPPSCQSKCLSIPQSPRHSSRSPSPTQKVQEPPLSPSNQLRNLPARIPPDTLKTTARSLQSSPVPHITYTSNMLPKPILKKNVSRPVSRATDEDIQGSKDALMQDLEQKLRNKVPQQRNNQKISYEERMARRLLGADNAASVFHLENSFSSQPAQPGSPEDQYPGGIWSRKKRSGGDSTEASTIQEKCFAPRFIQVPQDVTVEEGRFCRIDFKVVGLPTPDISWYLDGKPIRPDDYHKMLVCEKSVHSFIIEIVTIHHAGLYECIAKNRAGQSQFSLHLDVIAQEQLCPPTFVVKMKNSHAMEGDAVRLECKVNASPSPQLYWKKDKEMLRIDHTRMSLSQDSSGKQCLVINPVMKSDAGWYTVSAINEAGMSTCNARLDVATRLNKTTHPARPLKNLPIVNQFSTLCLDPLVQHTAPLYESEEL
ncbi:myotilin isoform X2 [Danio rerio]|uniref:Myotilin isoform X2 n=2 Tax=Danio rerio TaxID=7955 RepID=A0AC58H9L5_DANRE|nr:myotilin isoform X2 [Danio rerio]|eukprot:XP_021336803.1 myotilin isoform X2 [Danio rerio]